MYQVLNISNLLSPFEDILSKCQVGKDLRGYDKNTFITGSHLQKVINGKSKLLSVNEIAYGSCRTGRDVYIEKGVNRPVSKKIRQGTKSFEREAGIIGERFFLNILNTRNLNENTYSKVQKRSDNFMKNFMKKQRDELEYLENDSKEDYDIFISGLRSGGRSESILKVINSMTLGKRAIKKPDIERGLELHPKKQIGISTPSKPDFIIPKLGLIGDVKTGEELKDKHLLTCAGYALAYENEFRKDIDWGMIYFFKAKNYTKYGKQISLPQLYLFPIDDDLRSYYIGERNRALETISKDTIPQFPTGRDTDPCHKCKHLEFCESKGLVIQ